MPRAAGETDCAKYDATPDWRFDPAEKIAELDSLCAATCIDVPGRVVIAGYSNLRDIPLLGKLRSVQDLTIDVEGLTDLRGLEQVDVIGKLELRTHGQDLTSLKSINGLVDRRMSSLKIQTVYGLAELDGPKFEELDDFEAQGVGLERLDFSTLTMKSVYVRVGALTELSIGSGTSMTISLDDIGPLTTFRWEPLTARAINIVDNENLSSCLVDDFVTQTATRGAVVLTNGNGPCP
ncbi:MAG: hypothetical protein QM817_38295 [Archangium sp.]